MTKLFWNIAVLLIVGLLCLPAVPSADQAQYFYDELGRLVGVVDGTGNAADRLKLGWGEKIEVL